MDNFGSHYQRLPPFTESPPSYDDACITGPQPSAPPLGLASGGPPVQLQTPVAQYDPPQAAASSIPPAPSQAQNEPSSKLSRFFKSYINYSMFLRLRMYFQKPENRLDPELDVEAQFAPHVVREAQARIEKESRLQCFSGWLWCFGGVQITLYIVLCLGMFVTGVVAAVRSDCSTLPIVYLILGGCILALCILARILPSTMTCCKNKNILNTRESTTFTTSICIFELIFYAMVTVNLAILIIGTVWTFNGHIPICNSTISTNCCQNYVFVSSAVYIIFQYVLYILISPLFVCFTVCCIKNMDRVPK